MKNAYLGVDLHNYAAPNYCALARLIYHSASTVSPYPFTPTP